MIRDATALGEVRAEWQYVTGARDLIARNLAAAHPGISGMGQSHEFRNLSYNLCLLFAYSVLERVLRELRDEGIFSSSKELGALMANSKTVLPWQDYSKADEGRERRNDVAHRRHILERADCWKYIDAIEDELVAWGVVAR